MHSDQPFALSPGMGVLFSDLGLVPRDLLRRAGLPDNLLVRGPTTLSAAEFYRLWGALEDEVGADVLPIRIGQHISVESFAPPIFAAMCSPDLATAAARIACYKKLIGPMRLRVLRTDGDLTLQFTWPTQPPAPAGLVVAEQVFWVALLRRATRTPARPLRLTAPTLPRITPDYRAYLGVDIGTGPAEITFSAEDAARPFLTADARMWTFFEPELRRRLSELEAGAALSEQVRGVLLERLPAGDASMEAVSRALRVSSRTLQRRLREEGTSFQALLGATREALARHYLTSSALSAAEISFLLGYESPSSFYRAFHAWTGETPEAIRALAAVSRRSPPSEMDRSPSSPPR